LPIYQNADLAIDFLSGGAAKNQRRGILLNLR